MNNCSCGELVDEKYTQCPRCEALKQLGLNKAAAEADVRSAYRMLTKVWHPDNFELDEKLKAEAVDKLKNLETAFEFLTSTSTERGLQQRPIYISAEGASPAGAVSQPASPTAAPAPSSAAAVAPATPAAAPQQAAPPPILQETARPSQRTKLFLMFGAVAVAAILGIFLYTGHGPLARLAASAGAAKRSALNGTPATKESFSQYMHQIMQGSEPHNSHPEPVEDNEAGTDASETARLNAPVSAPQTAPQTPAAPTQTPSSQHPGKPQPAPRAILPFITIGTTKAEVLAQEGTAASASEDKLVYGSSELYFKDGRVTGWRIDPARPIRVKLWPHSYVNPKLARYSIGSTKDEVLAVQGTPTAFTDDKFEYGKSEVNFVDNKVVSWKEDPSSTPLWIH
jgi:hypothetical protein